MDRLIDGWRQFRQGYWHDQHAAFKALAAQGQSPRCMVIACSDSRVDPQLIFQATPGEIFVVRNVANLVPPYAPDAEYHGTSAALEFAVNSLKVEHVIVMGHSHCGGIGALVAGPSGDDDFVSAWMQIAADARERALALAHGNEDAARRLTEQEAIKTSLANLMTFPWLRRRVEEGKLDLHGWHFDIEAGDLQRLGDGGTFEPIR